MIFKSDGEPAIVALREALARCHGGRVTPEQPPRGEHQANGLAEEASRTVRFGTRPESASYTSRTASAEMCSNTSP